MHSASLIVLLVVLMSGCAGRGELQPPSQTKRGEAAGVRLTAEVGTWSGKPRSLGKIVLPLRVTIQNDSERVLRIRYNELELIGPVFDHAPLPPIDLAGRSVTVEAKEPVPVPRFPHEGFLVAPHYYPNFSELRPWDYPWDLDEPFYERQFPKWQASLPTVDMIEAALPEGALEPGGHVAGFLYYEPFPVKLEHVTLEADLIDARTGFTFGEIRVPIIIR